jgi:hypothetical protein
MSELSRQFDEIFAKLRVLSIVGTPLGRSTHSKFARQTQRPFRDSIDQREQLRGRIFFPNDVKWKYRPITAEIGESDWY